MPIAAAAPEGPGREARKLWEQDPDAWKGEAAGRSGDWHALEEEIASFHTWGQPGLRARQQRGGAW